MLLKVFLMTGGRQSSEYISALTASLMLWGHYESCDHPCWNSRTMPVPLSVLARDIARGGVGSALKKVSKTFALVEAKAEVVQDIGVDLAGDDFGSDDNARRLKPDRC